MKAKIKKPDKRKLKKKLDVVFSKWIRERDNHTCYTCGKQLEPNKSQCGHLFSRGYDYIRYDERNCHCQCLACNVFKHGDIHNYIEKFIFEYGSDAYEELKRIKSEYAGRTIEWYEEMIKKYVTD